MHDLAGKTVIITGAAGNLGRATALACARQGATLALVDRDAASLATAQQALPAGTAASPFAADLLDSTQVKDVIEQIRSTFGHIHVLANIAGGFSMGAEVHQTSDEDWDSMLALNLRTALNCTRAAVPALIDCGQGRIINVSARAATHGAARMAPYCVSKSAIITLTESLSEELKDRGITVNCVLPGTLDTPQNRSGMPDQDHSAWVALEALADVIVFLASGAARGITGAAIPVYGRS
ncbi:SDR family NAD(P)-dependent oxidoreductase [Thiocystis violacea]|uniref:SDR family NAD(P)-dependent oxidoreductase n=1 Tax=Thiocystis violacea TaxID=13725 RepID=UPI0019078932|nr:SDR family NAD(P)-dependent oxidoreductase [Thiocystis violacea]MBK1720781.1 3-oxoacyl-ACP reductase [Thiocystis violacea]